MKKILVLLTLALSHQLMANMAEPIFRGSQTSSPFTTHYVDIVQEELNIHILKNYSGAEFNIVYHLESHQSRRKIPMLFYGFEMEDDVEIYLNGQPVSEQRFIDNSEFSNDPDFSDFRHYFDHDHEDINTTNTKIYNGYRGGEWIHLYDLVYFEFDLNSGAHTIQVKYTATPWKEKEGWVDKTAFYYSLDPASQWKSFQSLDIQLTHEVGADPLFISLDSTTIQRNSPQTWHFEQLPGPILEISHTPEISSSANFFIGIGDFNLGIILFVLYGIIFMIWIYSHRKRKGTKPAFSWIALIGTLISPFAFTLAMYLAQLIIEWSIGEHLSQFTYHGGYIFFAFIFSLPWMIGAGVVLFITDAICRNRFGHSSRGRKS